MKKMDIQKKAVKEVVFNRMARQAFANRKAERYGKVGREMEDRVSSLLKRASKNNQSLFLRAIYHQPNSEMDCDGADFTVEKLIDGRVYSVTFGISISPKCCNQSNAKHPDRLQMCFPININDSTIVKKVEKLFNDPSFLKYLERE